MSEGGSEGGKLEEAKENLEGLKDWRWGAGARISPLRRLPEEGVMEQITGGLLEALEDLPNMEHLEETGVCWPATGCPRRDKAIDGDCDQTADEDCWLLA